MRLIRRILLTGLGSASLVFAGVPLCAAASGTVMNTVTIEQTGPNGIVGAWTLLMPDQTSVKFKTASHTVNVFNPGNYTLFVEPPSGMNAKMYLYKGGELVSQLDRPQMSFVMAEGDAPYRIAVDFILSRMGDVSVNSNPSKVPFELTGPNGFSATGVTPYSILGTPVGQYVVQYLPTGCIKPRPQSQLLQKDSRINFGMTIDCDTLEVEAEPLLEKEGGNVDVLVGGENVTLTDVPQNAWFATYVYQLVKSGVMTGYKDEEGKPLGLFGPENSVTIGELAKLAHEVSGIDETDANGRVQNPGARGFWFEPYIASAESLDWLIYQDPTLDLTRPATRGEVVVTFLQALDVPLLWPRGDLFKDVTRRTLFAGAIETAAKAKIVAGPLDSDGKPTGNFLPTAPVNRAELSKIMSLLIETYRTTKK